MGIPVLMVATFHLANPGLDYGNVDADDVLRDARQRELDAVVETLSRFEPTKVAVESDATAVDSLAESFRSYRSGASTHDRSEVVQLAFRLARRCGHETVFPIDVAGEFFESAIEPLTQAGQNAERWDRLQNMATSTADEVTAWLRTETIGEVLRRMNSPDARDYL